MKNENCKMQSSKILFNGLKVSQFLTGFLF